MTQLKTRRTIQELTLFRGTALNKIAPSLLAGIESVFLEDLTDEQKKIFSTTFFHQCDPNGHTPGEDVTLLRHLLQESGFYTGCIFSSNWYKKELYLYDLHKLTGIRATNLLKKEIAAVDVLWQKKRIASIRFETRPSGVHGAPEGAKQHYLLFELF